MKSDDRTKKEPNDRDKLLEEIRRRAEEAELQRIENEEQESKLSASQRGPKAAAKQPPPSQKAPPASVRSGAVELPATEKSPDEPGQAKDADVAKGEATQPPKQAVPSGAPTAKPVSVPGVPTVEKVPVVGSSTPPAPPPRVPAPQPPAPTSKQAVPPSQKAPVVPPPAPTSKQAVPPSQKAPVPTASAPANKPAVPPSQKGPDAPPLPPTSKPEVPPTQKPSTRPDEPPLSAPFPAPFPVPNADTVASTVKPAREQRITILRERLVIALDRGKVQKATELYSELETLVDDKKELEGYRVRLQEVQSRKGSMKEKKTAPSAAAHPETKHKEPSVEDRAQREARKKRIAELLDAADSLYQAEKYERSLQSITEILDLDPSNEEAIRMKGAIQKAQELAFRIQQEETRRKAEEAANYRPPAPEPPKVRVTDKDVWGTSTSPTANVGYELPPEEKGPVGPPKRPALEEFIDRLSKVNVPIRPLIIGGCLLLAGMIGYFIYDSVHNAVKPARFSLLILPATALVSDSGFTWISDGITEDLIRDFTAVNELRVIGAETALAFRNSNVTPAQLARGVGANYYLQWSILRAPDGVVVQPSFYDTMGTRAIWVSRYQTSMRELPAVRLELVHQLASVMKVEIGADEESAFRRYQVPAPEAYESYLRARGMMREREKHQPDVIIQTLERATALDSSFADAYSALGWAHILAYESAAEVMSSHLAQASVCVQRAIGLGARNAETFRVWGVIEEYRGQTDKAIERLDQAVSISPTDPESQRRLAIVGIFRNDPDVALKAATRAVADDPASVDSYTMLGLVQQFRGDYQAARKAYEQGLRYAHDRSDYASGFYADVLVYIQQADRASDVLNDHLARTRENPLDYYKLGRIGQSGGKPKQEWQAEFMKARTILQQKISADPRDAVAMSFLALVHTRLGEFKEAHAANTHAQQIAPNNIEVLYNTARMYALQRDKNQALEFLTKAVNLRYNPAAVLDMDFFNLHAEPEFLAAITR